ncbi:hypothetical protein Tco_0276055 [Tanacetum coccineum]
MYTQPQLKKQHPRLFAELFKSDYMIQKLQETCRRDALHNRPHHDNKDDDQHEGRKRSVNAQLANFIQCPLETRMKKLM